MIKCRSPRSLVLGIRNLLWFLVRSEYTKDVYADRLNTIVHSLRSVTLLSAKCRESGLNVTIRLNVPGVWPSGSSLRYLGQIRRSRDHASKFKV